MPVMAVKAQKTNNNIFLIPGFKLNSIWVLGDYPLSNPLYQLICALYTYLPFPCLFLKSFILPNYRYVKISLVNGSYLIKGVSPVIYHLGEKNMPQNACQNLLSLISYT